MKWVNHGIVEPEKIEQIVWDLKDMDSPSGLSLISSRPCLLKGQEDNLNDITKKALNVPILTLPHKKGIVILGLETLAFGLKTFRGGLKKKIKEDVLKIISSGNASTKVLIENKLKLPLVSTIVDSDYLYMGVLTFSIDKKILKKFKSILALCSYYKDKSGAMRDSHKLTVGLNELNIKLERAQILEQITKSIKENV